jgi:thioredoxin
MEEFEALAHFATVPVVMEFGATWCGPCRYLAPELERLAWRTPGRAIVATVDTDRLPEAALTYGVNSLPTMVLFQDGVERNRVVGAMTAETISRRLGIA